MAAGCDRPSGCCAAAGTSCKASLALSTHDNHALTPLTFALSCSLPLKFTAPPPLPLTFALSCLLLLSSSSSCCAARPRPVCPATATALQLRWP